MNGFTTKERRLSIDNDLGEGIICWGELGDQDEFWVRVKALRLWRLKKRLSSNAKKNKKMQKLSITRPEERNYE